MKINVKKAMAKYVQENCADSVFSIDAVRAGMGEINRKSASSIFAQWMKLGGIVIVGEYGRKNGGSSHKLFKVLDIEILVPKISLRAQSDERYRVEKALARQKEIDNAIIGLRINRYAMGIAFHA